MALLESLAERTTFDGTEHLYVLDGTDDRKGKLSTLLADLQASRWGVVPTTRYTAAIGTNQIVTMSNTSNFKVGLPVRYKFGGNTRYGIVTTLVANTSITITGAPLTTSDTLTELAAGQPEMAVQLSFFVSGTYANAVADILLANATTYFKWKYSRGFVVQYDAVHSVAAGTTQPKINIKVDGALVGTEDTNNGIQLSTANTYVTSSTSGVSATNYDIDFGNALEIRVTVVDAGTDASNLTVNVVVVLE